MFAKNCDFVNFTSKKEIRPPVHEAHKVFMKNIFHEPPDKKKNTLLKIGKKIKTKVFVSLRCNIINKNLV